MTIPDFEVLDESTQPTFDKEAAREEFALLDTIPTRLVAPTFELKGPPVPPPPARLLDPSFNTKDSK